MKDARKQVHPRTFALIVAFLVGAGIGWPLISLASPPIPDLAIKPEFDDAVPVTVGSNGLVFPLQVSYEDIVAGLGGTDADSRWCYWSETNCHHDYNAADILIPTGTPVVAPLGGTVIKAGPNNGSHNLLVKLQVGPDRCFLFMHMLPDSLAVGVGEEVAQGQLIGRVGTADDAVNKASGRGTIPHLHIEDKSCSGGGRNDVQAWLYEVFEQLPTRDSLLPRQTTTTTTTTTPPPLPPAPPVYSQLPPQPQPSLEPAPADMGSAASTVPATTAPPVVAPVATNPPPIPPPPPIYPQLPPMP